MLQADLEDAKEGAGKLSADGAAQAVRLASAVAAADATRAQLGHVRASLDTSECEAKGLAAELQVRG